MALPAGGVVAGGKATISAPSAGLQNVTQSSNRAVIDWSSFNIGVGERVNIAQPSTSSILLNRIHDQQPSQIFGSLTANGRVVLTNPNGMVFGPNSQVDVAGLVATASQLDSSRFMQTGKLKGAPGNAGATILNQGQITAAQGGLVALVAPEVRNDGTLIARAGKVQLSSGDTMAYDFYGDGLVSVAASPQQQKALVTNSGLIQSGTVLLSAAQAVSLIDSTVNMNGIIEATGLIDGGLVALTGDHLSISGTIHADGANGGTVNIGGNYQGNGPLPWAKTVSVTPDATLTANGANNGGAVVLWSKERTDFAGTIHANAASTGHGGLVETSSVQKLNVTGGASAASVSGEAGTWLLDPGSITIADAGFDTNLDSSGAPTYQPNAATDAIIRDTTIAAALNGGSNVVLQTTGADSNITASGSPNINYTGAGNEKLTLKASGDINLSNSTIQATGTGKLDTVLWSDSDNSGSGAISLTNATVTTNGGSLTIGGGLDNGAYGGTAADGLPDNYAYGDASNPDGVHLDNSVITTGAGTILLRGHGYDNAATSNQRGIFLGNGAQLASTSGGITLSGTGGAGTDTNYGFEMQDAGSSITSASGNITIGGAGGAATGFQNAGIFLTGAGSIASTGSGAGAANITLNGTGSDGANYQSIGILAQSGFSVTTVDGDIALTGKAGNNTNFAEDDHGIALDSITVSSTGPGVGAGTITLNGTSGTGFAVIGDLRSAGVNLTNSTVASGYGAIALNGTSASGTDYNSNIGLEIIGASVVSSTGSGPTAATISLSGIGSNSTTTDNYGVNINGAGTTIRSVDGAIAISGTSGNGQSNDSGIQLDTAAIITGTGAVTLTGIGLGSGTNNNGVLLGNAAQIASTGAGVGAATITLSGTGGAGTDSNNGIEVKDASTAITSADGAISLTGFGAGSGNGNSGVVLLSGAQIASTGSGATAATITLNGTSSGGGASSNIGIDVNGAQVLSQDGAIVLSGTGHGTTDNNSGIYFGGSGLITSTGATATAATISLTGASDGAGNNNFGIIQQLAGDVISSNAGDIALTGTGGNGVGQNIGISITDNVTTTSGAITLTGIGNGSGIVNGGISIQGSVSSTGSGVVGDITLSGTGSATGLSNSAGIGLLGTISSVDARILATGIGGVGSPGVQLFGGSANITSTGNGDVTLSGTAGSNTSNIGAVDLRFGPSITVTNGDLSITGIANGAGASMGLYAFQATIASVGTGVGAGTITLSGTGAVGSYWNRGIWLDGDGTLGDTKITTVDGAVMLTGLGKADGTDQANDGIHLDNKATIASTGLGTITLQGTGGAGTANNDGISLTDAGTAITSANGTITLNGTAGGLAGSTNNHGIFLTANASISSTGVGATAANISLTGTGSNGASSDDGIVLFDTGSITTVDGDIALTGRALGDGTGFANAGVFLSTNSSITSSGVGASAGTISLTGTGGNSINNSVGIVLELTSSISSVDGNVHLTGTGAGTGAGVVNDGIWMKNGSTIASTGTGATAANIRLDSTGGSGINYSHGIELQDVGTAITTVDGDIQLNANAGIGPISYGIHQWGGAQIASTGTGAGAGTITLNATGGNSGSGDWGVGIDDAGTLITSGYGAIDINGLGGGGGGSTNNNGITLDNGARIVSTGIGAGAATITLSGTGGAGTDNNSGILLTDAGTLITSINGAISMTGSGAGTGNNNNGISIGGNAQVTSTGVGALAATITFNGTSGTGGSNNSGIDLHSLVTSVDGDISFTGYGHGSTDYNSGINLYDGQVTSTGATAQAANISMSGVSDGGRNFNSGIDLANLTAALSSNAGNITLNGTGGNGNTFNYGINTSGFTISTVSGGVSLTGLGRGASLNNGISASVSSTGTGVVGDIVLNGTSSSAGTFDEGVVASIRTVDANINVTGTGGAAGSGVYIPGTVESTGNGNIMLNGTAGTISQYAGGVQVDGGLVHVTNGDLLVNGIGNSNIEGYGIYLLNSGKITSTGVGAGAGTITLNGTGANGAFFNNRGIYLLGDGTTGHTLVTSVDGAITLNGASLSTGNGSQGILINNAAEISSTGNTATAATITLNGTGAVTATGNFNSGIYISDAGTLVTSTDGAIALTGIGRGTTTDNTGITLANAAQIRSTGLGAGAATITLAGTGAAGGGVDRGIYLSDTGTLITSIDGAITVNGTGGNGGGGNDGLYFGNDADITSTGAANITLTGIAAASGGTDLVTTGATIDIGGAAMTGNIVINANTASLANSTILTRNDIIIAQRTAGQPVNIAGGAGGLDLDAATLAEFHADNDQDGTGQLIIGQTAGTGTTTLAGYAAWNSGVTFRQGATGLIDVTGNQAASAGTTASLTFAGPTHLGADANIAAAAGDRSITFGAPVTLMTNATVTAAHNGNIVFSNTLDGAHDLSLFTAGDILLTGMVGGVTRLGDVTVDPAHFTSVAGMNVLSFALTAGTSDVAFNGAGLNAINGISIDTDGNITGSYLGTLGHLYSGTGLVNATVTFGNLDINGAGATLLAGNIGAAGVADQTMANLITVNGVFGPGTPTYRFAGFNIGNTAPPIVGGAAPSTATPPLTIGGAPVPVAPGVSATGGSSVLTTQGPISTPPSPNEFFQLLAFNDPSADTGFTSRMIDDLTPDYSLLMPSYSIDVLYYGMSRDEKPAGFENQDKLYNEQ